MERLAPLVESFLASAEELKKRIDDIERVLDRQGLSNLKPGTVVDKDFCDTEHHELVKTVCGRADKLEKSLSVKVYGSWVVLVCILGWFMLELQAHNKLLTELIKEVF